MVDGCSEQILLIRVGEHEHDTTEINGCDGVEGGACTVPGAEGGAIVASDITDSAGGCMAYDSTSDNVAEECAAADGETACQSIIHADGYQLCNYQGPCTVNTLSNGNVEICGDLVFQDTTATSIDLTTVEHIAGELKLKDN
eukprot:COSAG06_NODE_38124_length_427_cov_0.634146_1_plen_141_part_11